MNKTRQVQTVNSVTPVLPQITPTLGGSERVRIRYPGIPERPNGSRFDRPSRAASQAWPGARRDPRCGSPRTLPDRPIQRREVVGRSVSGRRSDAQADVAGPLSGTLIGKGPRCRQDGPGERFRGRGSRCRQTGRGAPADDTLAAYIALYREKHVSTVRPGTAANINRELERMQDAWPGRSLRSISKKDVVAVVDKAMKRGPSAGVTAWKVAKAFFAWCEAREDDFPSPARSIRKPAGKCRDRVLDDNELKLTWAAADAEGGPAGALVKLLILSGARRNEITELAREEITASAIELPSERTKNGLPHSIPITPMIRRVLDALPSHGQISAEWNRSSVRRSQRCQGKSRAGNSSMDVARSSPKLCQRSPATRCSPAHCRVGVEP